MRINATLTTQTGSWARVKKHVDRNWVHDKNEDSVDKSLSHYNLHDDKETVTATDDSYKNALIKRHYLGFLRKRNAHFKKQYQSGREKTLSEYLDKKTPTIIGVATIGTMADKHSMFAEIERAYRNRPIKENRDRYYRASAYALKRYIIGWNKRNPLCPCYHYWENLDEKGAFHVHFACVPLGYTKLDKHGNLTKSHKAPYKSGKRKGTMHNVSGSKPSGDLTSAVKMEMHTNNNRKAFRKWSNREDHALVHVFGSTLGQRFSKVEDWQKSPKLQHTGRQGSVKMNDFKATMSHFDAVKARQTARKKRQDERAKKLKAKQAKFKRDKQNWKTRQQAFFIKKYDDEASASADKDLHNRVEHVDSVINRYIDTDSRKFGAKHKELKARNDSLKASNDRLKSSNDRLNRENSTLKSNLKKMRTAYNDVVHCIKNDLSKGADYFRTFTTKIQTKVSNSRSDIDKVFAKVTKRQKTSDKPNTLSRQGYTGVNLGHSSTPKGLKSIRDTPMNTNQLPKGHDRGKGHDDGLGK